MDKLKMKSNKIIHTHYFPLLSRLNRNLHLHSTIAPSFKILHNQYTSILPVFFPIKQSVLSVVVSINYFDPLSYNTGQGALKFPAWKRD